MLGGRYIEVSMDIMRITSIGMRVFTSTVTVVKWLPALLSHPHLLLSSTVLASTWIDFQEGCSGDSRRTSLVKQETIAMVNRRLLEADHQSDATLMVVLHLLVGEMWNCHETTLRIHEEGVGRLIKLRGGLASFVNQAVAEVTVG